MAVKQKESQEISIDRICTELCPIYTHLLHRKIHDQHLLICALPGEALKNRVLKIFFILVLGRCVLDNVQLTSRGVMGKVKMIHHKCHLS